LIQLGSGKGMLLTVTKQQHQKFVTTKQGLRVSLTIVLHVHGWLVLEVLPDAREIHDCFDSKPGEQLLWSNAGKLQDLRAASCSCGQNDFSADFDGVDLGCIACVARHELEASVQLDKRRIRILDFMQDTLTLTDTALFSSSKLIFVTSCRVSRWKSSLVWAIGR
jgi:hypothetical protein